LRHEREQHTMNRTNNSSKPIELLEWCKYGGCAAKLPPFHLQKLLSHIHPLLSTSPLSNAVTFNANEWEDVGTFPISNTKSLVMSVDMITPVVNDPFSFGKIATAHALSDIYAKGLQPIISMDILAIPEVLAKLDVAEKILEGMIEQLRLAGVALIGGHGLKDHEIKLGLVAIAICETNQIIECSGCQPGDKLILTKKIGTGIISTALKFNPEFISDDLLISATNSMSALSKDTAEIIQKFKVNASTDVTGFGVAGSLYNLAKRSNVKIKVNLESVPIFNGLEKLIEKRIFPQNLHHNLDFFKFDNNSTHLRGKNHKSDPRIYAIFDPQTSGGLLFSVPITSVNAVIEELKNKQVECCIIGECSEQTDGSKVFIEIH
jgi:selenide, water dikinase